VFCSSRILDDGKKVQKPSNSDHISHSYITAKLLLLLCINCRVLKGKRVGDWIRFAVLTAVVMKSVMPPLLCRGVLSKAFGEEGGHVGGDTSGTAYLSYLQTIAEWSVP
jgi:hypothetical protein